MAAARPWSSSTPFQHHHQHQHHHQLLLPLLLLLLLLTPILTRNYQVVLPQLVKGCCMPLPLAAGTSVATVVITAAAAAIVQA